MFEFKIFIYLQEQLKIPVTTFDDQICFLFIVNIEKIKIRHRPLSNRPIGFRYSDSLNHQLYLKYLTIETYSFSRLRTKLGKHINYTSVYYPKHLLAIIKYIRRSQLYIFSSFKCFTPPQIFKSSFLRMDSFSVHVVIDLPKLLFVVKA